VFIVSFLEIVTDSIFRKKIISWNFLKKALYPILPQSASTSASIPASSTGAAIHSTASRFLKNVNWRLA
jgi:hypothetical protein